MPLDVASHRVACRQPTARLSGMGQRGPAHGVAAVGAPPAVQERYYAVETIVACPLFIAVSALVARYALPDPGGRPVGIAAVAFGLLMLFVGVRTSYRATVDPDGTLTFTALSGSV